MDIREDALTSQKIADFLQEHLDHMIEITPPGSVYALDLEALRSPNITFWSAWEGDDLLGCGALKQLSSTSGEIKSMRTAEAHRRKGIGSKMLQHIIQEAQRRNYRELNLETASMATFAQARAFYTRHGFTYRDAFSEYTNDPDSVFMTKAL